MSQLFLLLFHELSLLLLLHSQTFQLLDLLVYLPLLLLLEVFPDFQTTHDVVQVFTLLVSEHPPDLLALVLLQYLVFVHLLVGLEDVAGV